MQAQISKIGARAGFDGAKPNWSDLKRKRKAGRAQRCKLASRYVPRLQEFCSEHDIEMKAVEGGFQFRFLEYVIVWFPATNRVLVQYQLPDHKTVRFEEDGQHGKPRVMVALEEMVALARSQCIAHC
jgi:hypothetical protein